LQNGSTDVPPANASASPIMAGATARADIRASSSTHGKEEKSTTAPPDSAGKSSEVKPPLKPPTLSLDALAKAKRSLQMQKELAEKMKKLPQVSNSFVTFNERLRRKHFLFISNSIRTCSHQMKNSKFDALAAEQDRSCNHNHFICINPRGADVRTSSTNNTFSVEPISHAGTWGG